LPRQNQVHPESLLYQHGACHGAGVLTPDHFIDNVLF
jgi:hypothetical protein